MIMIERKPYRVRLQVFELAHVAALVNEAQHAGIVLLDGRSGRKRRRSGHRVGRRRSRWDAQVESLNLGGDLRELNDGQFVAVGKYNGAKYGVFELADVARPVVARQQRGRFRRKPAHALALLSGETSNESAGEVRDIGNSRPQRRDGDGEHIKPIE